ncbi:unnamed protein product [Aphanomyces euteiches]
MNTFGLEFGNDDLLGELDFGGPDMGGPLMGSGLDSPGQIPFSVGTPTGIASLGTGFPGAHPDNAPGGSNNNQASSSGPSSDMPSGRNDGFHDDNPMFFEMDKNNDDDKSKTPHPAHAPNHARNPHMNHDKPNQVNMPSNNAPGSQNNIGNNGNMHHNNSMGRKDSTSDPNISRPSNGPPLNQNSGANAPKPGGVPGGPRMSESSDQSTLLTTLLMPDNPGAPSSMGGPPGARPHINQGGSNVPPGAHPGMSQYNSMGPSSQQPPYGQPQHQRMMMGNPNVPGGPMYGGYNQPPPQQANQPRPPYQQLTRTMSMNSNPNATLMRQSSMSSSNFPTNYEEELAKLKSMLSAQPDLIPPPPEVLRVTQQHCMANMQRMQQMQQHNPNGGNFMGNMPPGMQPNNQMQSGYPRNQPSAQPSPGMPPQANQPPSLIGMDSNSVPRTSPSGPGSASNAPNHPPGAPSASPPSATPARPGVSPPTNAPQNQLATSSQMAQGGAGNAPGQMVSQAPGKTTNVWQSESDVPLRRKMIAKIVSLLQQRKPDAPTEWIRRLPDMARRLEDSLYRTASGRDVYGNFNTLKTRLQHLAVTMGARAAKGTSMDSSPENAPAPTGAPALMAPGQQGGGPPGQGPGQGNNNGGRPGGPPSGATPGYNPSMGQPGQPQQPPGNNAQQQNARMSQQMQHQMHMQMQQNQQQNQRQMQNQQHNQHKPNQASPGQQRPGMANNNQGNNPNMPNQGGFNRQTAMNGQQQQQQQQQRPMYGQPNPGSQQQQQPPNNQQRMASPNPGLRMNQPPAQRPQATAINTSSRLSDSLDDMDSSDFLGDLGIPDDSTDMGEDPIDALMRGSDASKEKKSPGGSTPASPKDAKGAPKRPMPGQVDNQGAKRAKAPAKRTPRNNSASPPVSKTPPPSANNPQKPQQPMAKTPPPPVNK